MGAELFRAEDESRTRDLNLGKVTLYQLSYFRLLHSFGVEWDCKGSRSFYICQDPDEKKSIFFSGVHIIA